MRLLNFELASSVELQSDGLLWDLHNCAYFEGLDLIQAENAVVMKGAGSRHIPGEALETNLPVWSRISKTCSSYTSAP